MNILTQNNIKTMSSREIAELTSKRHDHVCRDIDNLNKNYEQMSLPKVGEGYYTHPNTGNQQHRQFLLSKEQTIDLITGYRADIRIRINRRWAELERQAQPQIPQSYAEALQLAADQAKQLELAAPKVSAYDKLIESTHLKSVGDVAKSIGLRSAQALNKKLEAVRAYDGRCGNRVWSGWFVEQGLGEMRTTDEGYSSNKMTAKGQAWALNLFGGK
ncbi:Rha family transcriptional regulator [Psychrobacter celer]|uniref:Rha family transcriptional regulator n=1 Tax=Psychrobacter celer TaxID=306572 RepID=UPI003FD22148